MIAVHDLGGEGEPLLICHATGLCGRAYEPLAEQLRAHHHVSAVDLRGHGDSPPAEGERFEWTDIVQDALDAAHRIGGGPIHLVGHSLGGAVSLLAARLHPTMFASAYVYEPIVVGSRAVIASTENRLAAAARKRRAVFPSRAEALLRYAGKTPLGVLQARSLAAYIEHGFEDLPDGTVRLKCRPENEAAVFEASGSIDVSSIAGATLPVIVATGGEPGSVLAALAPAIVAALPNAERVVYEHLGHFGPLQDTYTIARDVLAHTRGASAARALA
jgi:pimeloyl-ACP methyl ester carboxylesterase